MSLSLRGSTFLGCPVTPLQTANYRSVTPVGRLSVQAIKEMEGTVVSTKMQKTIVVSVTRYDLSKCWMIGWCVGK